MSIDEELLRKAAAEASAAWCRAAAMQPDERAKEWLVDVPLYNHDGIVIDHWEVSEEEANLDKLRAAFNPQRGNRSLDAGTYTRFTVDGEVWMSDTPAEIRDLMLVDEAMATYQGGSMLMVGLGLGVVLRRAITMWEMSRITVIERDHRVVTAVGPHYARMADEHGISVEFHVTDIHDLYVRGEHWNVGWFDIWQHIDHDDMAEVRRLRNRFSSRLDWFGAWAQDERRAQGRRLRSGKWVY